MKVLSRDVNAAIASANRIAAHFGSQFPLDLHAVASTLGVVNIEPQRMEAEGCLGVTARNELVIRFREDRSYVRTRFTIAHEIAHILLANAQKQDICKESFRMQGHSNDEEHAVNVIASQLLMPETAIRELIAAHDCSWRSFNEIANTFGVSFTALIRRMLDLNGVATVWIRTPNWHHCSFPVVTSASRTPLITFDQPPAQILRTALSDYRSQLFQIHVFLDGHRTALNLHGRFMGRNSGHWYIGWKT